MLKTRTDRRKAAYFVEVLGGGCALAMWLHSLPQPGRTIVVVICVVIIAIGVLLQRSWGRNHFLGRRAQRLQRHAEAVALFDTAIADFSEAPWKQHPLFVWHFWWSPYTTSILAMMHNNKGVSYMALGRLDETERALERAIAIDALYPTAHANLGTVALQRGDVERALRLFETAKQLGDRGTALDALIRKTATAWGEQQAKGLTPR